MKLSKAPFIVTFMLIIILVLSSCSGFSKNQSPITPSSQISNLPLSFGTNDEKGRAILAVYDAKIDPISKSFTVTPIQRVVDYHFPLTQLYPNVLQIIGYGWTPNFWADIKITHPFPGSGIDGFDPRVIAVLPARSGVSMYYPGFNVTANNSVVKNHDGYTDLFDHAYYEGNINPYKAYFKDTTNRVWSSTEQTEEILRWELDLYGWGGTISYLLVVDVSTNFPNPPEPITDNAKEPVSFDKIWFEGLSADESARSKFEVTVLSWPGRNKTRIKAEFPDLNTGVVSLTFDRYGPDYSDPAYRQYVFSCYVDNPEGISGDIKFIVQAKTTDSPHANYYEGTYTILDPVTVHHVESLGINRRTYIDPPYAYVIENDPLHSGDNLHIIDISIPETAFLVNSIAQANCMDVYAKDGYAYVPNWDDGLDIIDVDPPETAYVVFTLDTLGQAHGVDGEGDYLYCVNWNHGGEMKIIDISDPLTASIVGSAYTLHHMAYVSVLNGYAYIGTDSYGLHIVDVDPVPEAHEVKHIEFGTYDAVRDLDAVGNYCYLANEANGLQIIDITVPEEAYVKKQVADPCGFGVRVINGFAYLADCTKGGLTIIDVDPVAESYVVEEINTPYEGWGLDVYNGYAYINDYHDNLQIVKLY